MSDAAQRRAAARAEQRKRDRQPTCAHPGCGTVLSGYNESDVCYQHEPSTVMRRKPGR